MLLWKSIISEHDFTWAPWDPRCWQFSCLNAFHSSITKSRIAVVRALPAWSDDDWTFRRNLSSKLWRLLANRSWQRCTQQTCGINIKQVTFCTASLNNFHVLQQDPARMMKATNTERSQSILYALKHTIKTYYTVSQLKQCQNSTLYKYNITQ